jgi:hypothetical protein
MQEMQNVRGVLTAKIEELGREVNRLTYTNGELQNSLSLRMEEKYSYKLL